MKKIIITICFLLVAAGVIWKVFKSDSAHQGEKESDGQPQVVSVARGSIRVVVEATGRVVPEQEVEIKCKASGEIIKLPVDISDIVKKGNLLVQIDPENEKRSVERAEVALSSSQARLAQAKLNLQITERDFVTEKKRAEAGLKSAQVKEQEAQAKHKRAEQLILKKMLSRQELDGVKTLRAQASAELESARARIEDFKTWEVQIASRRQDIKIAEAQVESDKLFLFDARQRLEDTTVLAPIDGVVAERNVQVGQIIASGINNIGGGTTVMKLADLSHIYVLVSVDESDIGMIEVGQQAQIVVDAHPKVFFPGQVVRVATKGTINSNVVTFEVKVKVTGSNQQLLKPEMTANVEIVAVEKNEVLLIPVAALERKQRESFVTVWNEDGTTEQRAVLTGASDGEFIEIISGLNEADEALIPDGVAQGRWQSDKSKKGKNVHNDMRRMRMLGGGRRR